MDIEILRNRVRDGYYLIKSHAIRHALKRGLTEKIVEWYPDEQRVRICGKTTLSSTFPIYLHVVCEYVDPEYIEIVTAYIPDQESWKSPPFERRKIRS